ncbi:response regulator transcription factor [Thiothrix subterranea]|uniref:Response regulator transcription factor n=1 Tax=Thiothrix subterranea TaxID=2735563 RepID=A0AA51MLL3_9GAMM|nr:response regulator transcription factor [Thiothrix subterranea]MDQ5769235.1 response regulator transcription factor [Thiothrix subterranea]WML86218.1 response regulator transcription factor [Thiothrix subterranea]
MQHALIVEDVPETSEWLRDILTQTFGDIRTTQSMTCQQARDALQTQYFNLALLDLNLPDGSGIDLISCVRQRCPDAYIVITTIFDDEEHILKALRAGAHGYLLKDSPDARFIQKLRGILSGDPPLSPSISRRILRYFTEVNAEQHQSAVVSPPHTEASQLNQLSPREQEVLTLVAKGLSRNDVAKLLTLSNNTVARYIRDVYQKLNISSRAEAAVEACRMGLVNTDSH